MLKIPLFSRLFASTLKWTSCIASCSWKYVSPSWSFSILNTSRTKDHQGSGMALSRSGREERREESFYSPDPTDCGSPRMRIRHRAQRSWLKRQLNPDTRHRLCFHTVESSKLSFGLIKTLKTIPYSAANIHLDQTEGVASGGLWLVSESSKTEWLPGLYLTHERVSENLCQYVRKQQNESVIMNGHRYG